MSVTDVELIELLLAEGMKVLNFQSRIDTEHESDTEAWVNLVDLGVSVFCDAEGGKRNTISGEITVPEFQIFTLEHQAATRDEPEDTYMAHRRSFGRVNDTVAEVFSLVVKDRIYGMIEAGGIASSFADDALYDDGV